MVPALTVFLLLSTPCPSGQPLEGGQHTRFVATRGPVHLWCRGEVRSVVVYVHGFWTDVDGAFRGHELAAQFARSGVDALFIAVEAPSGPGQEVVFGDLEELLGEVTEQVGAPLPEALLVVGHSGAYRTLQSWLASDRVGEVVLLDGFYGHGDPWSRWLGRDSKATLRLVGQHTWDRAEAWRKRLPAARRAQVSHQPADCRHMELVTRGEWLPRVIRESSLSTGGVVGG